MNPIQATTVVLSVCTLGLIAWDLFMSLGNKVPNSKDTISGQMLKAGTRVGALPFGFGVLAGHFFWQFDGSTTTPLALIMLNVMGVAVTGVHAFVRRVWPGMVPTVLPCYVLIGFLAGHFIWGQ